MTTVDPHTAIDYDTLRQKLASVTRRQDVFRMVVDAPFEFKVEAAMLNLGIIVLLLVDKATRMIDRVALSNTELAKGTTDMSVKRFEDIKIPLDYPDNIIAKAIRTQRPQRTTDWRYLFEPALTAREARLNQAGGAIACSVVYPLPRTLDGGALIFSYYQYPDQIGSAQRAFMKRYAAMVAERLQGLKS